MFAAVLFSRNVIDARRGPRWLRCRPFLSAEDVESLRSLGYCVSQCPDHTLVSWE